MSYYVAFMTKRNRKMTRRQRGRPFFTYASVLFGRSGLAAAQRVEGDRRSHGRIQGFHGGIDRDGYPPGG